jgi:pyrroloquinoline quinone (PQQ) biosynthesis protein C
MADAFAERIERFIVDTYFRDLPPIIRAMALEPTPAVGQAFVLEWTKFSRQFPRWVGAIIANCPEFTVIAFEIENLFSEVVRDPASNTNHYELLVKLGAGLGLSRETIEAHESSPEARRAFDYWWRMARQPDWLLGFTAINGLEILGDRTLPRRYGVSRSGTGLGVTPWREMGLDDDALEFFRVSDEADEGHGREAVEIIARYTVPGNEHRVLTVLEESISWLRGMLDAMYALSGRLAAKTAA